MKIREIISEVSLKGYGDYAKKATMSKALAQMDKGFGYQGDHDRTIANREKGLARHKSRVDKFWADKNANSASNAVEHDRANKHGLEAELAKLEREFDPNYEYSDDHSVWRKNKDIHGRISGLKARLAKISETATAGATSSANIASVPNPNYANKANKKKVKSVNALDTKGVSLFGGPAFKR
jgi:hypothetical protein